MWQRITIAKIGGVGGNIALERIRTWADARNTGNPSLWEPNQWPEEVRNNADEFCDRLREHGYALPVIHFVEFCDTWTSGYEFERWLNPKGPIRIHANRHEIFAWPLPDEDLIAHFASAGPQQYQETDYFIARLREAVGAWQNLVQSSVLMVLRFVIDVSASDEQVTASLDRCPEWLS
jgi:hypothetical protein